MPGPEVPPRDWGLRIALALAALLTAGALYLLVIVDDDKLPTRGPSMGRTLGRGPTDIDVDVGAFEERAPAIGDIVVAQAPRGARFERCGAARRRGQPCSMPLPGYSDLRVVKRIVAGPGDEVAFAADGRAIVNRRVLREPYVRPCRPARCGLPRAIRVAPGHWFLAGDNRRNSSDSRYWGPVPFEALDGLVNQP